MGARGLVDKHLAPRRNQSPRTRFLDKNPLSGSLKAHFPSGTTQDGSNLDRPTAEPRVYFGRRLCRQRQARRTRQRIRELLPDERGELSGTTNDFRSVHVAEFLGKELL